MKEHIKKIKSLIFLSIYTEHNMLSQPTQNIPRIFTECSLNVVMFWTYREHLENILKGNIFNKNFNGKVAFVLKMYDLMITNADLLANSSNVFRIFKEHFMNFCLERIPSLSSECCKVIFHKFKKCKKFCGLSCKTLLRLFFI